MRKVEGAAVRKGLVGMKKEKGNGLNAKPKGRRTPLTKGGAMSKKKKKDLAKASEDGGLNQVPNNVHINNDVEQNSVLGTKECSNLLKDETDPYCPDFDEEPALLPPIGRKRKPLQNNGVKAELVLDQLLASLSHPENGDGTSIPDSVTDEQNDTKAQTTSQMLPIGSPHVHVPEGQVTCMSQVGSAITPKKPKKKKVKVEPSLAGPGVEIKDEQPKPKKRKKTVTEHVDGAVLENGTVENSSPEHSPPKKKKEKSDYKMDCSTCAKTFRSEKIYTRHLKICGLNEDELVRLHPHKCTECEYRSPKKAMVARHMESHGIFKCLKCDYVGDSKETFKLHTQDLHKDRADMRLCRICSRYVKCDVVTLDKHMEECKGKVPLFCPECKKEFKYESSLSVHLNSHYPDRPKRFSCEQCDYKSNYKANLQKHISCMHENRVRSVKCTECDKLFYSEESMRRHAKLHTEERLYKCEVCGQDFKTQATLKGHKELHNPERPYSCSINDCDKGFRSPKLLKKHQDEFHQMSPKRFHCRVEGCSLSFFKASHLRRHETTHTGERNYKCDWEGCGKAFRHADNLKIHKRQHTNEKPVKCEFCDFSCRQKSSLQWHKNKHHPEVRDGIIAEDAAFWEAVMAVVMEPEQDENKDGGELSTDVKMEISADGRFRKENSEKPVKKSKKKKSASPVKLKDGEETPKAVEGSSTKVSSKKKKKSIKKEPTPEKPGEGGLKEGTEDVDGLEKPVAKSTKGKKKKGPKLPKVPKVKGKKKGLTKSTVKVDNQTADTLDNAEEMAETEKSPKKKGPKKKSKTKAADQPADGEENADIQITKASEEEPSPTRTKKSPKMKKPAKVVNSVSPKSKVTGKKGKTKISPEKPSKTPKKKSPKKKGTESPEKEGEVVDGEKEEMKEEGEEKGEEAEGSPSKTKPLKKRKRGKAEDLEEEDEPKVKKARKSPEKNSNKSPTKSPTKSPAKKSESKKVSPKAKKSPAKTRQKKLKSPAKGKQKKAGKGSPKGRPKKASKIPPKPKQKKGKKQSTEVTEDNKEEEAEIEAEVPKVEEEKAVEEPSQSVVVPLENGEKTLGDDDDIAEDSDSDLWGINEDNNNEEERDRNCDADDERELDNDDDMDKFSELDFRDEGTVEKPAAASEENLVVEDDAKSRTSEVNNSMSDDVASLDDAIPDTPPRAPLRPNDNEEDVDENDYYEPPPSPPPPPPMDPVDQRSIERQDSEQTVLDNSLPLSNSACTPQEVGLDDAMGQDALKQPLSQEPNATYVRTPQSQQPEPPPVVDKDYFGRYLHDIPTVENQVVPPTNHDPNSPNDVPEDLSNIALSAADVSGDADDINSTATPQDLRAEPVSTITHTSLQRETVSGIPNANIERETVSTITHTSRTIQPIVTQPAPTIPLPPGMQTDVMSYQRMELLACGRQAESYLQQKESSLQRLTSITYQNFGNLDPANPTSREMNYLRPSDPMFARSCAGGGFMRVSEGDPSLGRAGMNSFLRQPDTTFARPETALTRASNPSLLRPGTVGEDLFARDAMGRPVSRSPFHGAWTGQEIRPAHWNQTPYLQRPVERTSNSSTPALLGKDNYLPDRADFTFDPTRTIPEQNMFSNLTSQQHELPRDTPYQLERFDLSSYFGSHPYTATPGLDYGHPTCGANQKAFEDRLRQPTSVPDLRGLPQPPSTDMLNQFCGINVNPSFNLDKYMYARDPVYRPQHVAGAGESAFLSHTAPTQPTYFGRDYAGRTLYPQSTPYALMDDRQYGPASKLTHPSGVQQERDLLARRTTSNDNQIQDPYRRSVIYNVMNRFYE